MLAEGSRSRIEVMDTGITVSSGWNLELQGGSLLAGHAGKVELAARRYLWLRSGESGLLLMPDQVQMSAADIRLGSYQSKPRIVLDEDSVEEILFRYEAAKASVPELVASDGSIVRREGYDDILRDDFLYTYFLTEVCDQDPKYTRTHDQPYATLYEQWLDDAYGKTELGKFWEYLSTIDGIQAMLDVGGFIFDWCDVINCAIYLCRGKYEEAMWSAVCAIPLWGSLIGKGGRKAVSLAGDLAEASQTMKLASEGSQAIRKLSLVLEVPADLVLDFDKAMSHFADQLKAAMMAPEYNRLYMAGIEYVNDVEIFYRMTDGAVDGMQSAWRLESNLIEEAADVWKVPEEGGRVEDDVIEGGSNTVKDGASRAAQYSSGWGNASLQETIDKFAPNAEPMVMPNGKIIYNNQETGISVVYDKKGNYFRIEDTTRKRGRNYLDLDGNDMNNEIVNGKTRGRSKADYQRVTHFNNSDK